MVAGGGGGCLVALDGLGHELDEALAVLLGVAGGDAVNVAAVFHCLCRFRRLEREKIKSSSSACIKRMQLLGDGRFREAYAHCWT